MFDYIPEEGMHIDDVVEIMMKSQSKEQIEGLKDMSNFPLQMGKTEVQKKLLSIANKIEIETRGRVILENYINNL
jgi:DNA-binding transcriptional regulator/RsmH inhibitor MraZ